MKTLHHNELLPFNCIPEELPKEQRETETDNDSDPEPTARDLLESESSCQSSSKSSPEHDDHANAEESPAQLFPAERLLGELGLRPRTRVRNDHYPSRSQRQRNSPGWLMTRNWIT